MVELPGKRPDTRPVPGLTLATPGKLLLHIPPGVPLWLSREVLPVQKASVPLIGPAVGVGSSVIIIAQLVPLPSS
jgi:hypothetical protein